MSEAITATIIGLLGGLVGWYIAIRKAPQEIKVLGSQETNNLATAAQTAANVLIETLKYAQEERKAFEGRVDALEAQTADLAARKAERELQIRSMEFDISQLRKQVGDWESKYTELEKKYTSSRHAIQILVTALQDANIPIPEDLKLILGDSISKFVLPKAGRKSGE